MTIIALSNAPARLRGHLSRWMIEPAPALFVGKLSADVAERLWTLVAGDPQVTWAAIARPAANEQGFSVRTSGPGARKMVDHEGLWLVLNADEEPALLH